MVVRVYALYAGKSSTETVHSVDIDFPVNTVLEYAHFCAAPETDAKETHFYCLALSVIPIIEIIAAQKVVDDLGASASSFHYRRTADRMWSPTWIPSCNRISTTTSSTFPGPFPKISIPEPTSNVSDKNAANTQASLTLQELAIPTRDTLPPFNFEGPLQLQLRQRHEPGGGTGHRPGAQGLATTISRPGHTNQYAKLSCGF
ncbi:hypothetical protein QBC32DRAFT_316146 [Pseudoneurospora amorphoporcata]|uniref:Uncharacterized protein n=1 Tax=Pseudoneurospora amorphoporcata TaxID=241081 RepID=A0AAN6SE08_9PEZI|nr:hypothetical protein QBC32DRAFT_316146 [Pseudoneurospora amorphoporcata]